MFTWPNSGMWSYRMYGQLIGRPGNSGFSKRLKVIISPCSLVLYNVIISILLLKTNLNYITLNPSISRKLSCFLPLFHIRLTRLSFSELRQVKLSVILSCITCFPDHGFCKLKVWHGYANRHVRKDLRTPITRRILPQGLPRDKDNESYNNIVFRKGWVPWNDQSWRPCQQEVVTLRLESLNRSLLSIVAV